MDWYMDGTWNEAKLSAYKISLAEIIFLISIILFID